MIHEDGALIVLATKMVAAAEAQRKRARAAGLQQQKKKQRKQKQRVDVAAISSTDPTLPKLKLTRDSLVQSGGESGPRIGGCVLSHAAASSARPSLR